MVFKKLYGKNPLFKGYKKKGKKTVSKVVKKYVKYALAVKPEHKNTDLQIWTYSNPSTTPLVYNACGIPIQGDNGGASGVGQRIGDSIDMTSLDIIWNLTGSATAIADIAKFTPNTQISILVGIYKHPEGAGCPPAYGYNGVYDLTTINGLLYPNAPYSKLFRSSWIELYKANINVSGICNTNAVNACTCVDNNFEKNGKIHIPLKGHKMKFNSNGGVAASVSHGLPFIIVYGDAVSTQINGQLTLWSRLTYTDS